MQRIQVQTGPFYDALLRERSGQAVDYVLLPRLGPVLPLRSIVRGRVLERSSGSQHLFVALDRGPAGVLPLTAPGAKQLSAGQNVLVQIVQEAHGDKGPKLDTRLSLLGPYLVLKRSVRGGRISRRLAQAPGAKRAQDLVHQLAEALPRLPALEALGPWGLILRQVPQPDDLVDLAAEAEALVRWMTRLLAQDSEGALASLTSMADVRALALYGLLGEARDGPLAIAVDQPRLFSDLPVPLGRAAQEGSSAEDQGRLATLLEVLRSPRIPLSGGGQIWLEPTRALLSVDIDAGPRAGEDPETVRLETNRAAAAVLLPQLKLRGAGGLIAVDFLNLARRKDREGVLALLDQGRAADPLLGERTGFSPFGLVQLVRERERRPLYDWPAEEPLFSAQTLMGRLKAENRATPGGLFLIEAERSLVAWLEKGEGAQAWAEATAGLRFRLCVGQGPARVALENR